MTVFSTTSKATNNVGSGMPGVGGHVHFPKNSGGVELETPGPGSYLHAGGDARSTQEQLGNTFGGTSCELKFTSCPGGAVDRSTSFGYKRSYWTKGLITNHGLMYLPRHDNNKNGPAERNLSAQTIDGIAPAFAPLREPHLRPKQTIGKDRRFREEEARNFYKSGIHELYPPGPGEYVKPCEVNRRYVDNIMMAPAGGVLHPTASPSSKRTGFGKTSRGPGQRPPTPTGRSSWIQGALVEAKSCAPDVGLQNVKQTTQVVSDLFQDISKESSFFA